MTGPLNGIRVIECSTVAIGRWAAQTLGDLDAKVIKTKSPTEDTLRYLGPARARRRSAVLRAEFRHLRVDRRPHRSSTKASSCPP